MAKRTSGKTAKKTTKTAKSTKKQGDGAFKPTDAQKEVMADFKEKVNMAPAQIEKFLKTDASKGVGFKKGGSGESVGHQSGKKIIEIRRKKQAELTKEDLKHMKKVVGYISRHCKQGPHHKSDEKTSRWRHSLMNWGHDPLKHGAHCGRA